MISDTSKLLKIARDAAMQAGMFLSQYAQRDIVIASDEGKDIKISADIEAEKIILDVLKQTDIAILSEESGVFGGRDSGLQWVVDPLDGSLNFSRAIPLGAVSIALMDDGKPVLGVIYDFYRNDVYSGIVGEGAWLGDASLHVSQTRDCDNAIIATGFPSESDYDDKHVHAFVKKVQQFKKVRLLGSAAMSLAYVAAGSVDVYAEKNIKIWDVAAGIAIVLAAGGKIEYIHDTKLHAVDVMITNGNLIINA